MKNVIVHKGPHAGYLALVFAALFLTGLYFVISLTGTPPYFPGPWESADAIGDYFQHHAHDVMLCAFFQFCASIPLGIFTATMVSTLRFHKVKAAGTSIALFGGIMNSCMLAISALLLWVMAYPDIAQNLPVLRAFYYAVFAIGGVGYSVPFGILIAGIAMTSYFTRLLPRWLSITGIGLALIGELSCLSLVMPSLLFLIPLTRFPGFIWLILAGFKIPKKITIAETHSS